MTWFKTPKWIKRFYCKHVSDKAHKKYNVSTMNIVKVQSLDYTMFGTGGTLFYHRCCSECGYKDCLIHHISADLNISSVKNGRNV